MSGGQPGCGSVVYWKASAWLCRHPWSYSAGAMHKYPVRGGMRELSASCSSCSPAFSTHLLDMFENRGQKPNAGDHPTVVTVERVEGGLFHKWVHHSLFGFPSQRPASESRADPFAVQALLLSPPISYTFRSHSQAFSS